MNMHAFLHMGGYAFYVWTSYGLAALLLIWNLFGTALRQKRLLRDIARTTRRKER